MVIRFDGLLKDDEPARQALKRVVIETMEARSSADTMEVQTRMQAQAAADRADWILTAYADRLRVLYIAYWVKHDWAAKAYSCEELVREIRALDDSCTDPSATSNDRSA